MKNKFISALFALLATLSVFDIYGVAPEKTVIRISPGCSGRSEFYDLDAGVLPPPPDVIYPDFEEEVSPEPEETIFPEAEELLPKVFMERIPSMWEMISENLSVAGCSGKAYVKANPARGFSGGSITLISDHEYYIKNETDKIRNFRLHTKILTHDGHCEEREDYFSIKPHSESHGVTRLYFDNLYKKKGSFTFCAYTLVGLSAESSARDIGKVTVK